MIKLLSARTRVREALELIADRSAQLEHEHNLEPFVPAYRDLVEMFYESYFPADSKFVAAFAQEELDAMREVDAALGSLPTTGVTCVADLHKLVQWNTVISKANVALSLLGTDG